MSHLDFIKTNKASFCEVWKLPACHLAARRGRAWYQAIGWQILPVTWAQYTGWLIAHLWCIENAGDAWIEGLHVHLLLCLCMTNSRVGFLQPSHIKIKMHPKTMDHVTTACSYLTVKQILCAMHNDSPWTNTKCFLEFCRRSLCCRPSCFNQCNVRTVPKTLNRY